MIKDWLNALKLSERTLASQAEISRGRLRRILADENSVTRAELLRIVGVCREGYLRASVHAGEILEELRNPLALAPFPPEFPTKGGRNDDTPKSADATSQHSNNAEAGETAGAVAVPSRQHAW